MARIAKDVKRTKSKDTMSVRITNTSNQMIPIQLSAEGEDFYRGQQQVQLKGGQSIMIDEKYLVTGQVTNLQSRGLLKLTRQPKT